ncbi:vancomycin resistance protein VanJ [Nocardiopsis sp. Huas11]|uniref:endonuclease/exonuclease/phosphatase family protein n=1 Tax=Nocardiopsis sp. Huas11 TaxID=2183912 RepID=UPI000EAE9DDA|nr:endonuclease/exonuclease/phosphatase family protein [Nocardiopsis sp. Huas11]RKS07333.1 vancomycin resistance protein VanJ [Nocardiopsis sp. Huas11]
MTRTLRASTSRWGRRPDRADLAFAAAALLLGLLMALHAWIPNLGGLGSLVETFLPWLGLGVPVLLAGALWRRSVPATAALLVPVLVWAYLFGGQIVDTSGQDGGFTVVSHNVGAGNPDPVGTARDLAAQDADVLALQELTGQDRGTYERELARAYPYHTVVGTVGLWSRTPLSDARPVDTRMDVGPLGEAKPPEETIVYNRALRATVATDGGPLAVYAAHLGSVRVVPRGGFVTGDRDRGAQALAEAVAAEELERVVLLGDLNGAMDDRAFDGVTAELSPVQDLAGSGFGFSWPAAFPVVRLDQILVRGVEVADSRVLPATGSDHRPVAADLG